MKYEKEHRESRNWFLGCAVIVFLMIACVVQSGCATVKGLAHDTAWAADKLDQSITVPE